jgi:hypothetical protein
LNEMDPIRWVVWIVQALLRALLPSSGRHRGTGKEAACAPADQHVHVPAVRSMARVARSTTLRGEDIGHVRPYLVAFERRQEAQRQRARRRTLWLAVHGVDIGSRMVHGVRVAS